MADSLGEKLRQAREARGYTIREVADQTRISVRHLEGIDADDYSSLPGGVFNKGFLKSYARLVGVDEKEALADYARLMTAQGAEEPRDDQPIMRRSEVYTSDAAPRSPWLTIFAALVILGGLTAGVIYGVQWWQNRNNQTTNLNQPNANSAANVAVSATPTPTPTPAAANNLSIQLRAAAQEVNITPTVDGKRQPSFNLKPGEPRDFTAQNELRLQYAKARAGELQMTVNGRPGKVQTQGPRAASVEMVITRDNFAQFLQGN